MASSKPTPKGDILIVDDNPVNLDLLSGMLLDRGYRVRVATNGRRAISAAKSAVPDLVMLDINMPGMDGITCARRLFEREAGLRVLFASGYSRERIPPELLSLPHVSALRKPFTSEELARTVDEMLA